MTAATIIIPLLHQEPGWLERSVKSALNQTVDCTVVVVQSHHTPVENRDVLNRLQADHANLSILTADAGCGYGCSYNLGINSVTTDRVGFLLADDWLDPRSVELCLPLGVDIVSTQNRTFDADGTTVLETAAISQRGLDEQTHYHEKADYLGHFLLFKASVLFEVGGVDTTVGSTGPDDFDLLWTMLERGATAAVLEQPLYNYRDHGRSWRLSLRSRDAQLEDLEKILDKHDLPQALRPALRRKHGRWFGRSIHEVRLGDTAEPGSPIPNL